MSIEQSKDDELMSLKSKIDSGDLGKDKRRHYLVVENLVYYISNIDDDPYLRLYVPKHLRGLVVKQYHDMKWVHGCTENVQFYKTRYIIGLICLKN